MNEQLLEEIGLTKGEIKVYLTLLKIGETTTGKIIEEAQEFIEDPCEEEAADMLEVLFAFAHLNGIDFEDVLDVAREKTMERGGFYKGIILQEVLNETG